MEINTARLTLREYGEADAAAFMAYQSDPRAQEFYEPAYAQSPEIGNLIGLFREWAAEVPRKNWQLAIAPRDAPAELIGSIGLRLAGAPPGVAEFGLELAPEVRGRGYATEAAQALLAFGFTTLRLESIRGISVSANWRVSQLVERLRFRRVAEQAGAAWLAERGWHEVTWELRREDWSAPPPGVQR